MHRKVSDIPKISPINYQIFRTSALMNEHATLSACAGMRSYKHNTSEQGKLIPDDFKTFGAFSENSFHFEEGPEAVTQF